MPCKIVCMCGSEIGYRVAEFLLSQPVEARFVVNGNEMTGEWCRTPQELKITRITEDDISEFDPDLIIVAFYHRILPESIFSLPRYGCWNLHLGDTEKYRGAYPNINALQNGDTDYAVTMYRIDEGIDSGDILAKSSFSITRDMTGKDLYFRMTEEGFNLFIQCYPDLASGRALQMTRVQIGSKAETHYRKELSHRVHPSTEFINSVRALTFPPFPPPFFMIGNRRFIISEELKEKEEDR